MREILADKKGFTLFEIAVVLAALALVATAAIPYFIRQAELAAAQRTAKEVSSIQEAAKWYRIQTNSWPASVGTLQSTGFLNPSWSAANPWGNPYSISSGGTSLTVTTHVPDSVGGVLARVLPGASSWVTGTWRGVSSTVPVPGQEASLSGVTNLANNALNTANNAQTTANSAQSTANNATNLANNAQSAANTAQNTANNAQSTANSALSMAQQSALPPFGSLTQMPCCAPSGPVNKCPDGYVVVGFRNYDGTGLIRWPLCQRVQR